MKATIFIQRENEQFWVALENKSGFVNEVIYALKENDRKERSYGEVKETEVQGPQAEDEGGVPIW